VSVLESASLEPGRAPSLAETLARIEARLARIERAVDATQALSSEASNLAATAVDILDERIARLGDVEARLAAASDVIERLTRPNTLASLRKLVDIAENAPKLVATFTDVVDEGMAGAAEQGLELAQVVDSTKRLLFGLLKLTTSVEFRALLDSGMLDPRALTSLGQVANALVGARETPAPRVGLLGAMRALGRPDVQRALGFLLQVAANLGHTLEEPASCDATKRLPAG
jgi:uncharacterized protein YjgD (DUF1641 family)